MKYMMNNAEVRRLCVKQRYYTCGDNEEYGHMLLCLCKGNTLEDVLDVAEDIYKHSDKDKLDAYAEECGKDAVKIIAEQIINECTYIIIE